VSITGDYDPVGGYLVTQRMDWAYMSVRNQVSRIDQQDILNIKTKAELAAVLAQAITANGPPNITLKDPHSWENYVKNHQQEIGQWLSVT
jgi:hypothetical protein